MPEQAIVCPNCGTRIPLTKALSSQLEEKIRSGLAAEFKKRERDLKQEQAKAIAEAKASAEKIASRKLRLELHDWPVGQEAYHPHQEQQKRPPPVPPAGALRPDAEPLHITAHRAPSSCHRKSTAEHEQKLLLREGYSFCPSSTMARRCRAFVVTTLPRLQSVGRSRSEGTPGDTIADLFRRSERARGDSRARTCK